MKDRRVKSAIRFWATVLVSALLITGFSILTKGMYLIGIPGIKDVDRVTISYPEMTEEIKEVTDEKQVELAVKLTGFLKYALFEETDETDGPLITITYFKDNGESIAVSANRKTVWWKGKARAIKEKEMFVNLTEGIFFFNEQNGE